MTGPNDLITVAMVENGRHTGQPGDFQLATMNPPELGAGERLKDVTPPVRFQMPSDPTELATDMREGTYKLYGTPLTHWSQQFLAVQHGLAGRGFDASPVTFRVHWAYFAPGLFTVQGDEWIQEETPRI